MVTAAAGRSVFSNVSERAPVKRRKGAQCKANAVLLRQFCLSIAEEGDMRSFGTCRRKQEVIRSNLLELV